MIAAHPATVTTATVRVQPSSFRRAQPVLVTGSGWQQIEFCKPRVVIAIDGKVRARALLDGTGRFSLHLRLGRGLAVGQHAFVAEQTCENGNTGALFVALRIKLRVRVLAG